MISAANAITSEDIRASIASRDSRYDRDMATWHVARDRSHELSVSRSACAPLCLSCQKKQIYRGTKDFWETLRILCSGVEEDLPNVLRPRLPLWGSEVGFGAWSSEKGLRGTGKVKSSDTTANNARRKRATVKSHVSFDHFPRPPPRRPPRIRQ